MPVSSGSVVWMTPATSPSPISRIAAPVARTASISLAWRGRSRMQAVISDTGTPLALARLRDVFGRRGVDVDDAVGIAGADGDLVHVDVGREQQAALLGDRDDGERVGQVLGADRRAFERIERDVDLRALAGADLLADIEHRRLVALALADHDRALDGEAVELRAHGVDRDLVGGLLVAAPAQPGGGDGGALGDAHEFQGQDPVEAGSISFRHS